MDCPFCTLNEIKERIIVENDLAKAFLTHQPIVKGHTLIVPKRCIANFSELKYEEVKAIFDLKSVITDSLKLVFGAEGFNYAWNEGFVAGQTVPHFHLHIVPRTKDDTGIYEYEPRKYLYRPGPRPISNQDLLLDITKSIKLNLYSKKR